MNLYKLHSEPETLLHHDIANDFIPALFLQNFFDIFLVDMDISSLLIFHQKLKKQEKYIAKDAKYSYLYARDILNEPFPLGEKALSKNAQYAYWYAKDVLNGRFLKGEDIISTHGIYSYWYAFNILKKQFFLGESKIVEFSWKYPNKVSLQKYVNLLSDEEKIEFKKKYL